MKEAKKIFDPNILQVHMNMRSLQVCFLNMPRDEYFEALKRNLREYGITAHQVYVKPWKVLDLNNLEIFDVIYFVNSFDFIEELPPLLRYKKASH